MLREVKKINSKEVSPKKWKFFNDVKSDEIEKLIEFYSGNPALCYHYLVKYRGQNLRQVLLGKLTEDLEGKFTIADIKQRWLKLTW